jgi:hypothetical protein
MDLRRQQSAAGPNPALAALTLDAVLSRVLARLDKDAIKRLRFVHTDLRDACDRQVKVLRLSNDSNLFRTLASLPHMVRRSMWLERLDLRSLAEVRNVLKQTVEAQL